MQSNLHSNNIGLWSHWILSNAISWAFGITASLIIEITIFVSLSPSPSNFSSSEIVQYNRIYDSRGIIFGMVFGLLVSIAQWLCLRKYVRFNWFIFTFASIFVIALIGTAFGFYMTAHEQPGFWGCLGFDMPPVWLQKLSPWNQYGQDCYNFGNPIYAILIGVFVGLVQFRIKKTMGEFSRGWIVISALGFGVAFLAISISEFFRLDIFIVGIMAGGIYGLISAPLLIKQLTKNEKSI